MTVGVSATSDDDDGHAYSPAVKIHPPTYTLLTGCKMCGGGIDDVCFSSYARVT